LGRSGKVCIYITKFSGWWTTRSWERTDCSYWWPSTKERWELQIDRSSCRETWCCWYYFLYMLLRQLF